MLLENQEKLNNKLKRIENLEAMLSNETLGAERFNAKLEQFLGYGDIKLEFDQVKKGWDSQMGRGIDSSYVADVVEAKRKHLFVKKSDAETNFYYVGQFDIIDVKPAKKKDNAGKERDIAKFRMKMHHAVREDLLRYLQSNIMTAEENVG